jgi:hypothetical protein
VGEEILKKIHNVFMTRWSDFHTPIHSDTFAMDKQFCRKEVDEGIKKDIRSVMEDFSTDRGDKDFSTMKTQHVMGQVWGVLSPCYDRVKKWIHDRGFFFPPQSLSQILFVERLVVKD